MKGMHIWAIAIGALVFPSPSRAEYVSIIHQLLDGVDDTRYDHTTGIFEVDSVATEQIVLNDPFPIMGVISNSHVQLITTFDSLGSSFGVPYAQFAGGNFSLTFDFDDNPNDAIPPTSHELSGPIRTLWFRVWTLTPTLGRVEAIGSWVPTTIDLPGSNAWPVDGGYPGYIYSGLDSLIVDFDQSLADFDWMTVDLNGRSQAQYALLPTWYWPEPASFTLLAFGSMVVLRRRAHV